MINSLPENKWHLIYELICPECEGELQEVSKHILNCLSCRKEILSFQEGERVIISDPCERCGQSQWMVLRPSQQIQCPLCDYIKEPAL